MEKKKSFEKPAMIIATVIFALTVVFVSLSCSMQETAVIDKNSSKEQIKQVQQALKDLGYYNMTVDGILGSGTVNAVKAFQKDKKLVADGIIGEKTLEALGISFAKNSPPKFMTTETNLLARVVHSQAKGELFAAQVAIAAVILNRIKHPDFPSTVAGVIFQPQAFNFIHRAEFDYPPDATALSAARDALNGFDPSFGSIYFYDAKTEINTKLFEKQTITVIGKYTFAA